MIIRDSLHDRRSHDTVHTIGNHTTRYIYVRSTIRRHHSYDRPSHDTLPTIHFAHQQHHACVVTVNVHYAQQRLDCEQSTRRRRSVSDNITKHGPTISQTTLSNIAQCSESETTCEKLCLTVHSNTALSLKRCTNVTNTICVYMAN